MEKISEQIVDLEDGTYDAIWSGYNMEIIIPDKESVYVETTIGVKGINCKTIVEVKSGSLYK